MLGHRRALPLRSHSVNAIAIASRMHAANISAATTSRGVGFLRALLQVAPQPNGPFKRIVPWPNIGRDPPRFIARV